MKTIAKIAAVTGGTGLLGSRLIFDLLQKGYKVKALKRKNTSLTQLKTLFGIWGDNQIFNKIQWIEGDMLSPLSLAELTENADYLFHCAAIVSFDPKDKDKMMEINVSGTKNAIFAALNAKIKKFCHTSSIAALGRTQNFNSQNLIDENCLWQESNENSNYAVSKYLAEKEIWQARDKGLRFVIVNPSIIIGAASDERSSSTLFSNVYHGNPFYTDGINGFVDVRDVSAAMIALSESNIESERFIISEGNYTYKYVFDLIAENLNRKKTFIKLSPEILNLLRFFDNLRTKIFNSKPVITKEIAKTAVSKNLYSNQKIKKYLKFDFIPIQESIKYNSKVFLELKKLPTQNKT